MKYQIRPATWSDKEAIYKLYKAVARQKGGIARIESEITPAYVQHNLKQALDHGICLIAEDAESGFLLGEIHCYKLEPRVFNHVLSELTIVVHPDHQGKGIGRSIFQCMLDTIQTNHPDILRVELIARESNRKAIELYQKLGFKIEGRFEQRIANEDGTFEADIPMAWLNPRWKNK